VLTGFIAAAGASVSVAGMSGPMNLPWDTGVLPTATVAVTVFVAVAITDTVLLT
jgi:hypothetical protein